MYAVLSITLALALLPPSLGLVDCQVACTRCRERGQDYPGVLEVYCAMCRECNERRRDHQVKDSIDIWPDDCPTPPPCDTDDDDIPAVTLAHTLTTSTTTTTTTTGRPCPPVTGCVRNPPRPRCYYPCLPPCPCPYPHSQRTTQLISGPHKLKVTATTPTSKTTGYIYVYVGVPRDLLQKAKQL